MLDRSILHQFTLYHRCERSRYGRLTRETEPRLRPWEKGLGDPRGSGSNGILIIISIIVVIIIIISSSSHIIIIIIIIHNIIINAR